MIGKIRGTRDILSTETYQQAIKIIKQKLNSHLFQEIMLPTIEHASLFQRSLGNTTEVITKEIYIVKSIHDENESSEMICLRPESTAQIMRAYLENNVIKNPWRVYTCGSMFRHERPQKGRYREFYSFSIEMIGAKSYIYDAELVIILDNLFKEIGIKQYTLELNFLGDADDRKAYSDILYNYIMSNKNNFTEYSLKIAEENPMRLFDLKDEIVKRALIDAPLIVDFLSFQSKNTWIAIQDLLKKNCVEYTINNHLVRGLDYYSDIVFEFKHASLGSQNTFCGGGRYNGLAKALGANSIIPSIGAGIGLDRLILIMQEEKINTIEKNIIIGIIASHEHYYEYAFMTMMKLINSNCKAEFYADKSSFKSALRKANNDEAALMCIIGETEFASQSISIKILKTGEQIILPFKDAIQYCINYDKKI